MKPPIVFIASSSEGLRAATAVRHLLLQELRDNAEIKPWTRAFELSATYIESLEAAAQTVDFAVFVLTSDDITASRGKKKAAPRDNVVFEMGLFMGSLGRERCFILTEDRPDLKLPSDLFGVHTAGFKRVAEPEDQKPALDATCLLVIERIGKLGPRFKLSRELLALHAATRDFCESVEGAWWERVATERSHTMSFFRIEWDPVLHSFAFREGRSYGEDGAQIANWKSVLGRVEKEENTLLYHWKGWHMRPELADFPFHGFGEMEFDQPLRRGVPVNRGRGKFWDVNEVHPEKTLMKTTELHRVEKDNQIATILGGNQEAIRSLLREVLDDW